MSEYYKDEHRYDDIMFLPHHQSKERPPMAQGERAVQFAPFSALSGHEEAIGETARWTEEKITPDETIISSINETLYEISQKRDRQWKVSVTYFHPDSRKKGGSYLTDVGVVKKIQEREGVVVLDNGVRIFMEQIVCLEILQNERREYNELNFFKM